MEVDEAWRYVQAGDIDHGPCLISSDPGRDGGNPAPGYRHVSRRIDLIFRVDEVTSLEEEVVRLGGEC
jgi:hypothetical protein